MPRRRKVTTDLSSLSPAQSAALAALLTAPTVAAAATASGVPERTLRKWLTDVAFRGLLAQKRHEAMSQATSLLAGLAGEAVQVLGAIMRDEKIAPQTRATCAVKIIECAEQAITSASLDARLRRFEARTEGIDLGASDGEHDAAETLQ